MVRRLLFALVLAVPSVASAQDFVGAETCGSCHEAQYKRWQQSGHSMSLARLSKIQRRDRVCRSCHTMDPSSEDPRHQGVQCENCHGAGEHYAPGYVMKDEVLAKLLGLEPVTENTCRACHTPDGPSLSPFVFAEKVKDICTPSTEPAASEEGAQLAPRSTPADNASPQAPAAGEQENSST